VGGGRLRVNKARAGAMMVVVMKRAGINGCIGFLWFQKE
jgi:hypothetical protein